MFRDRLFAEHHSGSFRTYADADVVVYDHISIQHYHPWHHKKESMTWPFIQGFWLGTLICVNPLLCSPNRTWWRTLQPLYVRSGPDVQRHCWKQCCSWSASSGQVVMVLVTGVVLLLRGVYAGVRYRERWSDWRKCGSCMALYACLMFV